MQRTEALDGVFSANRSVGRIVLAVDAADGTTRRKQVFEEGPLRVRFPGTRPTSLDAVIVNTAGGVAGGDRHSLDITVHDNATLTLTTAAAEKVYRALGPDAEIGIGIRISDGGRLLWMPQETILFDRVGLRRQIEIDVAAGSTLLMAEAVVFGRSAMGETIGEGSFTDRWRVRVDGRLAFADKVHIEGDISRLLQEPAAANGGVAIATVLAVPGHQEAVDRVRSMTFDGEVGVSAWNGLAVARLCAKDGAPLRRDLAAVVEAFGGRLPRLWLN